VRSPEKPFDSFGRLLAYIAPGYSTRDRAKMTLRERTTFNLDMVDSGWSAKPYSGLTLPHKTGGFE